MIRKFEKSRGQGLVEFSLALPVMLMLFFGVVEFGRLLFYYSAVTTASREAARYGSAAGGFGGAGNQYQDCAGIRASAKKLGSFVGIQDSDIQISYDRPDGSELISGNNPTPYANACPPAQPAVLGDRIIVDVNAKFKPIVPLVNLSEITVKSTARRTILLNVSLD